MDEYDANLVNLWYIYTIMTVNNMNMDYNISLINDKDCLHDTKNLEHLIKNSIKITYNKLDKNK